MKPALRFLPFVVGCAAIFYMSSLSRPPVPFVFNRQDLLLHAIAYGGLAFLAWIGTSKTRLPEVAFVMATFYGASDELHQSFVPGRSPSLLDLAADALGAALVVGVLCRRRWRR
jgi:VanZ family protein